MPEKLPRALATEINEAEGQYLSAALGEHLDLTVTPQLLSAIDPEILSTVEILIPFIHSHIGAEEMHRMPALRLIATRSTGYEHISLTAAAEHGVSVANVPGYGEIAVAEHTFALLLALSRKICQAQSRTRQGDFTLEGLRGFDLYGKTLGVVGAGAIGLHVIRIAKGFGMDILAYDVQQHSLFAEVIGFRYASLDDLLAASDIVSLHAPAVPSTYHLLNRDTFARMKHGAILINTARGSLIDTEALTWALDTGILAGAGLDTLEGEEFLEREEELLGTGATEDKLKLLVANHLLQRRSNVILTPHIAFNTEEALRRILETTIANVRVFLAGSPSNLVRG